MKRRIVARVAAALGYAVLPEFVHKPTDQRRVAEIAEVGGCFLCVLMAVVPHNSIRAVLLRPTCLELKVANLLFVLDGLSFRLAYVRMLRATPPATGAPLSRAQTARPRRLKGKRWIRK